MAARRHNRTPASFRKHDLAACRRRGSGKAARSFLRSETKGRFRSKLAVLAPYSSKDTGARLKQLMTSSLMSGDCDPRGPRPPIYPQPTNSLISCVAKLPTWPPLSCSGRAWTPACVVARQTTLGAYLPVGTREQRTSSTPSGLQKLPNRQVGRRNNLEALRSLPLSACSAALESRHPRR